MHSGEEGPASWVRQTVFDLGINRVDHGVHAADDDALLDELAGRETFFTLCPLSNVRLRVHKSVSESPIPKFLAKNIKFSLNSDDPAYFGGASLFPCISHFAPRRREARADAARTPSPAGYVLDNYLAVHDAFQFDKATWRRIAQNGIDGSWCSDERKAAMSAQLAAVLGEWEGKEI